MIYLYSFFDTALMCVFEYPSFHSQRENSVFNFYQLRRASLKNTLSQCGRKAKIVWA